MKTLFQFNFRFPALIVLAYLFGACNPQCDPISSITISSDNNPAGYEIMLRAKPASTLLNKTISFGGVVVPESDKHYIADTGMIVKVPVNSTASGLIIEDPDCGVVATMNFTVNSLGFYANNPNYVSPIMPEITIPQFVDFYPPSINNAWACPINTDYCLWFKQNVDSLKLTGKYYYNLNPGSFEKSTCGGIGADSKKLYATNPIYGYYDTISHKLFFTIDRTSKGAGTEDYIGEFINIKATPYNKTSFPNPGPCMHDADVKGSMLLVTSRKTGRQVLVFQTSVGP